MMPKQETLVASPDFSAIEHDGRRGRPARTDGRVRDESPSRSPSRGSQVTGPNCKSESPNQGRSEIRDHNRGRGYRSRSHSPQRQQAEFRGGPRSRSYSPGREQSRAARNRPEFLPGPSFRESPEPNHSPIREEHAQEHTHEEPPANGAYHRAWSDVETTIIEMDSLLDDIAHSRASVAYDGPGSFGQLLMTAAIVRAFRLGIITEYDTLIIYKDE